VRSEEKICWPTDKFCQNSDLWYVWMEAVRIDERMWLTLMLNAIAKYPSCAIVLSKLWKSMMAL
jgi:hypothetical protein